MNIKIDKNGSLDIAFRGLKEIPISAIGKKASQVISLDASHNNISSIDNIGLLTNLESLVLDHNRLTSHIILNTKLPKLQLLYVNSNKISNLSVFIDKLAECCPNLKRLSMLNNKACPNFFNGGTPDQYDNYRLFVISRFPHLVELDVSKVTPEEREKAKQVYGDLTIKPFIKLKEERKLKKRLEKKRREEERLKQLQQQQQLKEEDVPPPPPPPPQEETLIDQLPEVADSSEEGSSEEENVKSKGQPKLKLPPVESSSSDDD